MPLVDDYDRRREEVARDRENSARLAQSFTDFTSVGIGTYQYASRVSFGLTFIEKPFFAYGSVIDIDELANLLDLEEELDVILPQCTGFVTAWDQDERDFYVGCWIAVQVNFPSTGEVEITDEIEVEIEHHFTFAANAMKDVAPNSIDTVELVPPVEPPQ